MTALKKEGLHLPVQAQTSCWAPEGLTPTPLESYSVAQADVDLEILLPQLLHCRDYTPLLY